MQRDKVTPRQLLINNNEKMIPRDWKKALRTPHVYRVGKNMFRLQAQFVILLLFLLLVTVIFLRYYMSYSTELPSPKPHICNHYVYNETYPLTQPLRSRDEIIFDIAIVSDLDTNSKSIDKKNTWHSFMKKGTLTWKFSKNFITVKWNKDVLLETDLSMKGRGMELSELIVFDGKLLSFDDRTGTVFVINKNFTYPWLILMDGDGRNSKGFKIEWASVKDNQLYVGSFGKVWTTEDGEFMHTNPKWIKIVSPTGEVKAVDWTFNYDKLSEAIDIKYPGYVIHESGVWSNIHQKWFFLPRRCSQEKYNEVKDEFMSCNVLLMADEHFQNVEVVKIGEKNPIRGYSSFKFIPGFKDSHIVALKTEEYKGKTSTYLTVFTINGTILVPDIKIADLKFEGLEFV